MGKQKSITRFLGVPVPFANTLEISSSVQSLKRFHFPVNWEKPENYRIELGFLGKIDQSSTATLENFLSEDLAGFGEFVVKPSYLTYLYKKHEDSLIYLGFENDKMLVELEKKLRSSLKSMDFSPATRFEPMIVVGRLPRLRHPNQVKEALSKLEEASEQMPNKLSEFTVASINIFEYLGMNDKNSSRVQTGRSVSL